MEFTADYTTRHVQHWKKFLRPFMGKQHVRALEIGTWEGRTACWLLENVLTHPTAHITCVDTFAYSEICFRAYPYMRAIVPDIERRFDRNIAALRMKKKVRKIKKTSMVALRDMQPEETFDIVYVDGSHMSADVLNDAVLCWPLLRMGGLLIFDDYRWKCPVDRSNPYWSAKIAIDAFLRVFGDQLDILLKGKQVFVRKARLPSHLQLSEKRSKCRG